METVALRGTVEIQIAEEEKKAELDVSRLYTPLSVAKEEIRRRWNDKALRKKVEEFLGGDVPEAFLNNDEPIAVLVRYIASPNFELGYFLDIAKTIDLHPVLIEYSDDKFVAKNSSKYHLGNLFFERNVNRKSFDTDCYNRKIVDFNKFEGKHFNSITTVTNEPFVNFHHRILFKMFPEIKGKVSDFSDWFNRTRFISKEYYYLYYLALFVCHGILFENFLLNKEEADFTKKKVIPSLFKIEEMFGVKPLIVPLQSFESETQKTWCWYPKSIETIID